MWLCCYDWEETVKSHPQVIAVKYTKQMKQSKETSSADTHFGVPFPGTSIVFLVNGNNSTSVNKT